MNINKKITTTLFLIALATVWLGACAPAATPVAVETSTPVAESAPVEETAVQPETASQSLSVAVELNTTYENAVSVEQQLIFGTFKLEGTNLAISKEQAGVLTPLYANLKTIVESMMPAPDTQGDPANAQPQTVSAETQSQVDAIIKDILAAMTPEQVKAISEMQITREIAQTIMTEKGISMGGPGQGGAMPGGANGQPPEGAPPADGGQNGGGGAPQGDAPDGQQPGGGMIQPEVITVLIELLQTK
jgi:hypothetical protein